MFKTIWPLMSVRNSTGTRKGKEAKRCAIIDLSSTASYLPFSNLSIYSSTKAFNKIFTLGASAWLSNPVPQSTTDVVTPIDFLSVQPGFVDTAMAQEDIKWENMKAPKTGFVSSMACAKGAMGCLGKLTETPGATGHVGLFAQLGIATGLFP
jgi:short-subunit dehydrogenase